MSVRWLTLHCPYCGEVFEVPVETGDGEAQVVDCAVCCRPIHLRLRDGRAEASRDDDA